MNLMKSEVKMQTVVLKEKIVPTKPLRKDNFLGHKSQVDKNAKESERVGEDELAIQKTLYGIILERGCQSLSQASMRTGLEVEVLEQALNALIEKGLIRPVNFQAERHKLYRSYEVNI
jgi:hypothetical protein